MKTIHLILLVLFISCPVSTQVRYSYGFVGSYNSTSIRTDENLEASSTKYGFGGGVFLKFHLNNHLAFSIEPQVTQKNFSYKNRYNQSLTVLYDGSINYINFPLFVHTRAGWTGINPFVETGIFMSVVLSSSPKYATRIDSNDPPGMIAKQPISERLSESGVLLGCGLEISVSPSSKILVGYRYSPGVSEIASMNSKPWKLRTNIFYMGLEL